MAKCCQENYYAQSFFAAKNSKVEQAGAPPRSAREKAEPPGTRFFSAAPASSGLATLVGRFDTEAYSDFSAK